MPEVATDARGYGIQLILALQSAAQAERRWGKDGAKNLLTQMSAEVVLPGLKEEETLSRYSDLVGIVEVTESSTSFDLDGRLASESTSTRERRIMRADEIRRIPDGQGLMIFPNVDPRRTPPHPRRTGPDDLPHPRPDNSLVPPVVGGKERVNFAS